MSPYGYVLFIFWNITSRCAPNIVSLPIVIIYVYMYIYAVICKVILVGIQNK